MALFTSHLIAAASGSVGGLTFLPTKAGMAIRAKAIPVNTNSPFQNVIKALFAHLVAHWIEALTETTRRGWQHYATNVPLPSPLGRNRDVGALPAWIRSQLPRLLAQLRFFPRAPTIFDTGTFTPITPLTVASIGQRLIFAFNDKDLWANTIHSGMLVFISRPQNPTVQAFNKPYRFAALLPGNPFLPPTTPANVALPFPVSIGQKLLFRVAVSHADGRYTRSQHATATVT